MSGTLQHYDIWYDNDAPSQTATAFDSSYLLVGPAKLP